MLLTFTNPINQVKLYMACAVMILMSFISFVSFAQVNTGGTATTANHSKQVIGYITNWDAWKAASAGVPSAGALTHLNIDYSKYTILNFSFFGVAKDGSLHSGDFRNKNIYQAGAVQEPADIFYTDPYSSWDLYLLFGELDLIQYIDQSVVTRATAQGFQVTLNGTTWSNSTWGLYNKPLPLPLHKEGGAPGLLELAHSKGVKVNASIGGWSMCKHYPEMAADPAKRQKFIDDCVKLMNVGFDGIDLDWEYPGPYSGMNFTGTQADFVNFTNLIQAIRNAIGPNKLITAAMSADAVKLQGFEWSKLATTMNYFNIMSYDYNGGWSNKAGHNSPLYSYDNAEAPTFTWDAAYNALVAMGVPKNKINMGSPFYGRGVITSGNAALNAPTVKRSENVQPDGPITTCADFTNWPAGVYDGTPNYFFIKQVALAAGSGWTRSFDNQAKVPYLTKGNYFLSYDDEESIGYKAQYINDKQLAGTIVWTVFGDLEISGTPTQFGTKLLRYPTVKSVLVNKINEVFATGGVNPPPTTSITSPANNAIFTAPASITINANASDTAPGTVSSVAFYNGSTLLGTDTSSPYSFTWTNVAAGAYTLTTKATDNQGGVGTSSAITITVSNPSNPAPTTSITSPANNATFTAPATISIAANAADTAPGTVSKVDFYNGTTLLGTDTSSPYTFSWTNVAAGTYTLTTKATDDQGAVGTSAAITVTVTGGSTQTPYGGTVRNIPGKIEAEHYDVGGQGVAYNDLTTGNAGAVFRTDDVDIEASTDTGTGYNLGWIQAGEWVEYTVNVTTAGTYTLSARVAATAAGKTFHVEMDGVNVSGTLTVPNTTGWQIWQTVTATTTSLTTGQKVMRIFADQGDFNINYVDFASSGNPAPTTSITSPANGATFTAPASITINANAADTSPGTVSKVDFYNGTTLLGTDTSSPYSFSWTNVAAGTYSLTTKATDNQGAVGTSAAISVTVNSASNPAPTTSITSPANNATFTAPASITINANAADTSPGTVAKVDFYNGSTLLGTDTSSPYSFSWTSVAAGTYTLTTKATDNQGAVGTSAAITVTVSGSTGTCGGKPQYVENSGYVAGSQVKNVGNVYECKPYPYTGWCNGAAWAYAPGTGTYWTDAWTLIGACPARSAQPEVVLTEGDGLFLAPNPGVSGKSQIVTLSFAKDAGNVKVNLISMNGTNVMSSDHKDVKQALKVEVPALTNGLYIFHIQNANQKWTRKYMVEQGN
jgi:chitinase